MSAGNALSHRIIREVGADLDDDDNGNADNDDSNDNDDLKRRLPLIPRTTSRHHLQATAGADNTAIDTSPRLAALYLHHILVTYIFHLYHITTTTTTHH